MPRRCAAITALGAPCRAYPRTGSDRCFLHDTTHPELLSAVRAEGARAAAAARSFRARQRHLRTTADLADFSEQVLFGLAHGTLQPAQATIILRALPDHLELLLERKRTLDDRRRTRAARSKSAASKRQLDPAATFAAILRQPL